jgi:hypothetical protein
MKHCRSDYNERIQDSAGLIPENEPVFLLRGQDKFAYHLVKLWADMVERDPSSTSEIVAAVRVHATRMHEWQEKHGKSPDCPAPLLIDVQRITA